MLKKRMDTLLDDPSIRRRACSMAKIDPPRVEAMNLINKFLSKELKPFYLQVLRGLVRQITKGNRQLATRRRDGQECQACHRLLVSGLIQ